VIQSQCLGFTDGGRNFWRPDLDKVCDIIHRGGVPLILVCNSPTSGSHLQLDLVEYKENMRYVAISHVWAHGRGNPYANELPLCQLEYIVRKVIETGYLPPYRFWMDTLCVPLSPIEARKQAIVTIRQVYQEAMAVLVLDRSLEESSTPSLYLECLIRLITCDWTKRLWTLQEGRLPKTLFFQIGKGAPVNLRCLSAYSPENNLAEVRRDITTHPDLAGLWDEKKKCR
jgi:hypothetical protein